MNRIRRLLSVSVDDINVARRFVTAFLVVLLLVVTITSVAVASDPAPAEAEPAQNFEDPPDSKSDSADEVRSRIRDRLKYQSRAEAVQAFKNNPREAVKVLRLRKEYREAKADCLDAALLTLFENRDVGKAAASLLHELLAENDNDVRRMAAIVLGHAGQHGEQVIAALIDGLKHESRFDEMGGRGAARELAATGKPAVPALIKARAFFVLGEIGSDAREATAVVTERLRDNDVRQRIAAALALYQITDDSKRALPVLIAGFTDEAWRVRLQAVRAVGVLGADAASAEEAVRKLLNDEKYLVRQGAKQTLDQLSVSSALECQATKPRLGDRFVFYDASRGTQPTEQGFRLLDNARGHTNPQVTGGVLKQGPTTTQGYQRWYTAPIPIDFSAEGKGTAVEWTAQVKRSGLYIDKSRKREWTGWGVQLQDKNGHTFDIYLGEDRVLLNRDDGNMPIGTHKLDTTDRFHHYRFVIDDSQGMLFIDGSSEAAVVGKVGSPNQSRFSKPNEVAFGDCTTNALNEVHVKNFWYANNAQAKSPFHPEPKPQTALIYDAKCGTLPTAQGFQLVDDDPNHDSACVENGELIDGPTTTKGMRCWKSHHIPLDFRPQGSGLSAEWKMQVVDSRVDSTGHYSGWSASFVDGYGQQFLIGLGNNRIVLHNMTRDPNPAFTRFKTTDSVHHFRFVVDDNQGILYVDGKRLMTKPNGTPDKRKILANRVLFGDGTGNAGAHTKLLGFGYSSDARAAFPFQKANAAQILNESLILHYTFDDPRKDVVEPDESDHGSNAKIHGAVWHKQGMIGGAMKFDGKDDFLDCGNDKSINFGADDFTVALWFKTDLKHELPYSYNPFINKGAAGSLRPVRPGYGLYATIEHGKAILRWDFGQRSHAARARVISDAWEANCWNHVTMVRRDGAIEAFLNGQRVTRDVQKATSDASVSGPENLLIGKIVSNRGGLHFYRGQLDDIRIYDCALSEREIKSLVAMGDVKAISQSAAATTPADGLQQPTWADDVEAFHLAVAKGEATTVERMLSQNAALANHRNQDKFTPLFQAALPGHTEIAKLLLERGAKVDIRVLGQTPLFRACHDGHADTAKLLLDHGADIDAECNDENPLYIAIDRLHARTVRLLLDRGADPNWIKVHSDAPRASKDKRSVPLLEALAQVRWATQHLARKKTEGDKDRVAYYEKKKKTAEAIAMMFLTHRDINVNAKHPSGGAALHLVAEFGHMEFAKLLIELGADVNGRSERLVRSPIVLPPYNQTPLHLAFGKGHDDLVTLLLENGADPKAKDSRGKIPIEYSESNRAN